MNRKKLTGWLIVFFVWIGVFGVSGGAKNLSTIENAYRPYMADYPSLRMAITVFQLVAGAGIAVWIYVAWVLYRREPGTLARAQACLIVGAVLRIAGGYSIPLLGGFPADTVRTLLNETLPLTFFVLLFTGIWYMYLARSQKVREIYAC
jgi:hypothetical protein